jgi:(p)ppGpp synthase/HD superfamily hydrolase
MVADRLERLGGPLDGLTTMLHSALNDAGIEADISVRAKGAWSLFEKMSRRQLDFDAVLDVIGLRVVVDTTAACYLALGVVHATMAPIPGRFKDYVAAPKANLYQSLHTTVTSPQGAPVEIQIRSRDMHQRSQWGFAAHWRYKTAPSPDLLTQVDKALTALQESDSQVAILLDADDKPLRFIDEAALNRTTQPIEKSGRQITVDLQPEDTLQDALSVMLQSSAGLAVVTDRKGKYLGCCTIESLAQLIIGQSNGQGNS